MTKLWMIGAIAALGLAAPAAAKDPAVAAPIKAFADAFNKGDMATAAATMAKAGPTIVDEVAPYMWQGPDAFAAWGASYEKDAAANGITEPAVSVGAPTRELVAGDTAYVIVPSVYTFKRKGVAMSETAQMTFAMVKEGDAWKIAGWTWTGPDASPVRK